MTDECSKCNATLDTIGYPKWCKACRANYRREYEDEKQERLGKKGYARGVEDLRDLLAGEFDRLGSGNFSGAECAYLIRQVPAPRPSE
jgi:hypothetical protein